MHNSPLHAVTARVIDPLHPLMFIKIHNFPPHVVSVTAGVTDPLHPLTFTKIHNSPPHAVSVTAGVIDPLHPLTFTKIRFTILRLMLLQLE